MARSLQFPFPATERFAQFFFVLLAITWAVGVAPASPAPELDSSQAPANSATASSLAPLSSPGSSSSSISSPSLLPGLVDSGFIITPPAAIVSAPPDIASSTSPSPASPPDADLYLEVWRGELPTQLLGHFKLRNGALWSTPAELTDLGLVANPSLPVDADGMIALDALPGLRYQYDKVHQRLTLEIPAAMRPKQSFGYQRPQATHADRGSGLLLNYDSYVRYFNGQTTAVIGTDFRWFGPAGTFQQSGITNAIGPHPAAYERLDTRWFYSDPVHLWTWTAGDLITGGLSWTRPVRMGGIQWRRNFGVRPDLITSPVPSFASQATVPSSVDFLVNNVQQFGAKVDDGPFVLDVFPHISGAGEATLIVRDALGRVTQTTVPIYSDSKRLARGLTDFSFELGSLRHNYGGPHDGYKTTVFSASARRGLTDNFTLEGHAEVGPRLQLAGLGMVWSPFGHVGLVNAAVARSQGNGTGQQLVLGYQWFGPRFGVDMQVQRASRHFRDLGSLESERLGLPQGPQLEQERASTWVQFSHGGNLAYTWIHFRDARDVRGTVQTLSWSQTFSPRVSVTGSVFHDQLTGTGAGFSVNMLLGNRLNASVSLDHSNGQASGVATLQRQAPYEGGLGWRLQAGDRQGAIGLAEASFRTRYGDASFGFDHSPGGDGAYFQGAGSLVFMDGHFFVSRKISDSFAIVSTSGVPDIPISYENRVLGLTNSIGYLLVPDLRGWQRNRLSINPDALSANYRLTALEQFATPPDAGGTLVRFGVDKTQPVIVVLLGPSGSPVPAGTRGITSSQKAEVIVGLDGEAYVENAPPGTVIELEVENMQCRYPLNIPSASPLLSSPASDSKAQNQQPSGQLQLGPLSCISSK
jgi:outer membrane usher protein